MVAGGSLAHQEKLQQTLVRKRDSLRRGDRAEDGVVLLQTRAWPVLSLPLPHREVRGTRRVWIDAALPGLQGAATAVRGVALPRCGLAAGWEHHSCTFAARCKDCGQAKRCHHAIGSKDD